MAAKFRNWFGLATLATLLACAGCGKGVNPSPDNTNGGSLWQFDAHEEQTKLVSASVEEHAAVPPPTSPGSRQGRVESNPTAPSRSASPNVKKPPMLAVKLRSGNVEGLPIGLFSDKTLLMRTNGSILFLDKDQIVGHQVISQPFTPQDLQVLIADLQAEFGNNYRIRNAQPYLVIAKPNRIGVWCERFDRIQHSIALFCTTHSIPLRSLEFPLIAIVMGSRAEFDEYARLEGSVIPPNCVGYYSQKTNRIVLYENDNASETKATLETICHEATHQFAFNSGLHQRLAATPLWILEGFAVQFEAPAYSDYANRDRASFWPPSQRQAWESLRKDRKRLQALCHELITSDDPFKTDTLNAYTASWAMSSYLSQRRGRQYVEYIQKISNMKPFEAYSEGDRLRDFSAAFGSDTGILLREITIHLDRMR